MVDPTSRVSIQVTDVLRPKEDKFRDSKYATGREVVYTMPILVLALL